ncbi:hypothetical protein ACE6H2_026673 [Prunus campanulata]
MPVIFDLKHQVPSDDKVGALFSSEIGNIVRTSAPVCHLGWKKVSTDDKGKMRDSLIVLFEVDLSHPTSTSSAPAHVQTSTSSRGSNGVHSDADYYDELANQNLDEN